MTTGYGLFGYVEAAHAEALAKSRSITEPLTLHLEPANHDVTVTVHPGRVLDVKIGATERGQTAVQIVFEATPQLSVSEALRPLHEGVAAFDDPVLRRLTQRSIVNKIMV
jgi:hypothetical protein